MCLLQQSPTCLLMQFVTCLLLLPGLLATYPRLSPDAYPLSYNLSLSPNMDNFTYQGWLTVRLVMNKTDTFSLDCEGLELAGETELRYGLLPVPHTSRIQDRRLVVKAVQSLQPDHVVVFSLSFVGNISGQLSGFYLSKYSVNGTQRYLASTQLEPADARRVFPCFDEPRFRANFTLALSLDPAWSAISNTPVAQDSLTGGVRRIVFSEQRSIPPYLVGWVVFETVYFSAASLTAPGCDGRPLTYRVWTTPELLDQHQLALSAAPLFVQKLELFTGIKCKAVTEKVDLVAVPDFSFGAMENWALLTFRETLLLHDRNTSTVSGSQRTLMTVSHELAHQWFGNLVTPAWWSSVWLSEGFARYLQYFITHQLFPELRLEEQFAVESRQLALDRDGLTSHPLTNYNLTTLDDLQDIFDIITYDKGAAVIHMLRSVVGPSSFAASINKYLTSVDRSGGVTSPEWFFSSFPPEVQQLKHWTETSGYPTIVVREKNSTIVISQLVVAGWQLTYPSHWLVPIYISINGSTSLHYLQPNGTLVIPILSDWPYLVNVNQTGYYRVWYEEEDRWLLEEASPLSRSQLIDDAMALGAAGLLPYRLALSVARFHLERDLDYIVWRTALRHLSRLTSLLEGYPLQANFTGELAGWMNEVLDYVGFNDTASLSPSQKLHQMMVLGQACAWGHPRCLAAARRLSLSDSSPEMQSALLCTVVREGNTSTWDSLLGVYNTSRSPARRQLLLAALTCTTDRLVMKRLLELLTTDAVRRHDVLSVISLVSSSRAGAEEVFSFIKANAKSIYERFGESRTVLRIIESATTFSTDAQLSELKKMARSNIVPGLQLDSLVKRVEKSMEWKRKMTDSLRRYLSGDAEPATTSPINSHGFANAPFALSIILVVLALFI